MNFGDTRSLDSNQFVYLKTHLNIQTNISILENLPCDSSSEMEPVKVKQETRQNMAGGNECQQKLK